MKFNDSTANIAVNQQVAFSRPTFSNIFNHSRLDRQFQAKLLKQNAERLEGLRERNFTSFMIILQLSIFATASSGAGLHPS